MSTIGAGEIEEALCDNCGSRANSPVYRNLADEWCGTPGRFDIVRCLGCGLCYLTPRPTRAAIGYYYPDDYAPHADRFLSPSVSTALKLKRALRTLIAWPYSVRFGIPGPDLRLRGAGRVLDVGCGRGGLLATFQAAGWDVSGVEPSPTTVKLARRTLRTAQIYEGNLETVALPDNSFDMVTMSHSFEHVHSTRGTLERVHRLLRDDGLLWLALPNCGGWEPRMFGRHWIGYDVPRHLTNFSATTLVQMLTTSSFRVQRVRPQCMPSSVSESLELWLSGHFGITWVRRHRRAAYYLLFFPSVISYLLGNNSMIEVEAVKC